MKTLNQISISALMLILFTLAACSSNIPLEISQEVPAAPSFSQIQKQPNAYPQQPLRWGGTILKTENKHNESWVSIIAFPLNSNGRPLESDQSPGRFIAVFDQYLEPLVYSQDREITVHGTLIGTETIKVGEYPYVYPLLKVDSYYLWDPRPEINEVNPPYYWPYYPPYYNLRYYPRYDPRFIY